MDGERRVIVVGGGLAGLAATVRIAELGLPVDLFSLVPVKRSHSVCAQGGINACNEIARQQGYSEFEHFDETIYGGDFLQHQPPVYEMAQWAPKIIDLLDRMGVPFNRTAEGQRDLRLFGGSLYRRTHFSGATTGQQVMYGLDEQVRRLEAERRVAKYEYWEFLRPVIEGAGAAAGGDASGGGKAAPRPAPGRCVGIVAQDVRTMQLRAFRADAVVMATGGCGMIFGRSTNSVMCTGAAASRCYQAGAWYANGEFIQVHPTAIPGADKLRLMSESARGEGGRIWVPRRAGDTRDPRQIPEHERYYFLEEKYPRYGNIVPRDIAAREIFDICVNQGLGVSGGNMVYLDLTHRSRQDLELRLGGILEIYRKFVGEDPAEVPMKIFPGVHYSMGGLWTQYTARDDLRGMVRGAPNSMMTSVPGLYAFGEVNYQYHGANRLGGNALLSCIFDGLFCGDGVARYAREVAGEPAARLGAERYEQAVAAEQRTVDALVAGGGDENPYELARELGEEMTAACTVVRSGPRLERAAETLDGLCRRYRSIRLADAGMWTNQNLCFARGLGDMLRLAWVILQGAIERRESRGAHYRTDYPRRDDERFLRTTVAAYDPATGRPVIWFEPVETGLIPPRARTYGRAEPARAV